MMLTSTCPFLLSKWPGSRFYPPILLSEFGYHFSCFSVQNHNSETVNFTNSSVRWITSDEITSFDFGQSSANRRRAGDQPDELAAEKRPPRMT